MVTICPDSFPASKHIAWSQVERQIHLLSAATYYLLAPQKYFDQLWLLDNGPSFKIFLFFLINETQKALWLRAFLKDKVCWLDYQ